MATNVSFGSKCMIKVIKGYQLFISPLLGPSCRFYPTCSHYAIEAFERFGLFKGLFLSVKRILKCQPLHPGGEDPVPDNPKRQFKDNLSCSHQVDIEQSKIHQSKSNK